MYVCISIIMWVLLRIWILNGMGFNLNTIMNVIWNQLNKEVVTKIIKKINYCRTCIDGLWVILRKKMDNVGSRNKNCIVSYGNIMFEFAIKDLKVISVI